MSFTSDCELNFEGLVGPTHHYAGLAPGNLASTGHAHNWSNPQAAALQGLQKIRWLHDHGIQEAIMPPHPRPNLDLLKTLGFTGQPHEILEKAYRADKTLLSIAYSAASMWAANAATVTAAPDSHDGRIHFTPANQISHLHRAQEAAFNNILLQRCFPDPDYFMHHAPLPAAMLLSDEGAANHNRLCPEYGAAGVQLFVYGRIGKQWDPGTLPKKYIARQTQEAAQCIVRTHGIREERVIYALQNQEAIDHGVFHHDVIGVANENVLLLHESSFIAQPAVMRQLIASCHFPLDIIIVPGARIPLDDAVKTYLFNAQLLSKPQGGMMLLCPAECEESTSVRSYLEEIVAQDNPIESVHFVDLKQSMHNGGGPACLRLRIPISMRALMHMHRGIVVDKPLLDKLEAWVKAHYRDRLCLDDLRDPAFMIASWEALDALTQILQLNNLYASARA